MPMEIHPKITLRKVMNAVKRWSSSLADPGFCTACGFAVETGCEPDMTEGECEKCGEHKVHGASELLVRMAV